MVLCWIALPIFAILGIFSVRYRRLAVESLKCLWLSIALRPCQSTLDEVIRSDVTGALMKKSPRAARLFYNNYKAIVAIILVVMVLSTYFTAVGVYNYAKYGNCNGLDSGAFCIINTAFGNAPEAKINHSNEECVNSTAISIYGNSK